MSKDHLLFDFFYFKMMTRVVRKLKVVENYISVLCLTNLLSLCLKMRNGLLMK